MAADGLAAGGALDDSHDADIAAVAGTDAVPGGGAEGSAAVLPVPSAPQPPAVVAGEAPLVAAPQPGGSGKLLLTVHDGSLAGTASGAALDEGPAAGAAVFRACHAA